MLKPLVNERNMKTVLLGTGTPNAESHRSGPSVAIIADGISYVVDCGPGVVRRASAAFENGTRELEPKNLQNLFLTHLHSDHTAGLPDMILTPWVLERKPPLRVWGPRGTACMVKNILEAYRIDIHERLYGLEPANSTGIEVIVEEVGPGTVLEENGTSIEAFRVNHGGLESYGYRFTSRGTTVVISGDTAPFKDMDEHYGNCDILIHEVYSSAGFRRKTEDWRKYHRAVHTSAEELAEIAGRVKPGLLVLYHQLLHGEEECQLLAEITGIYSGDVVYGRDLDTF